MPLKCFKGNTVMDYARLNRSFIKCSGYVISIIAKNEYKAYLT